MQKQMKTKISEKAQTSTLREVSEAPEYGMVEATLYIHVHFTCMCIHVVLPGAKVPARTLDHKKTQSSADMK